MESEELRTRVHDFVFAIPEEIVYGHDPRIDEYKESTDSMKRVAHGNPTYLPIIETAYDGDRARFTSEIERSLALVGEEDVRDQEHVQRLAEQIDGPLDQALAHCAFNEFALHGMVARHSLLSKRVVEDYLPIMEFSERALCLNPSNSFVRLVAATTANRLGWYAEGARLAAPLASKAAISLGEPVLNYLVVREHVESTILALERHVREDLPRLPVLDHVQGALDVLRSSIVLFGIFYGLTANSAQEQQTDRLREQLYLGAYEALKAWALETGRIDVDEA